MKPEARSQAIELILSDVDGVMTDGGVIFDNQGIETKRFHIRDGLGIKLWQRAGYRFGIVTARNSHIVKVRASELGIDIILALDASASMKAQDFHVIAMEPVINNSYVMHHMLLFGCADG